MHQDDLQHIFSQFARPGAGNLRIERFGSGHIHDTYRVFVGGESEPSYVLQRINHGVFPDVPRLMQNMGRVTEHIQKKSSLERRAGRPCFLEDLILQPTLTGELYHPDESGQFWRVMHYVKNARSYDLLESPEQASAGGWAFGKFHVLLQDLDPGLIHEVIPDFHHVGSRLARLRQAVAADQHGRLGEVRDELDFIDRRQDRMQKIWRMGEEGVIPQRIIHNDTKFNNVLLDPDNRPLCVIDLDTVMPGYLAYDFGDAIRTVINKREEDEADLSRVELDLDLFEAYAKGYLKGVGDMLSQTEAESLIDGVLLLPYIQATRFLTDYLEGDHYFKTRHSGHNLQRTRTQLRLVQLLEEQEALLRSMMRRL